MMRQLCLNLAYAVRELNLGFLRWHLSRIAQKSAHHSTWKHNAWKLLEWLKDTSQLPPFTIFAKGNKKLPFWSFSVLPIVTCPGAGICATFCYSLKAWRYPRAFLRQVQNTILILTQSRHLVDAFYALPKKSIMRLYVDGDFDSLDSVTFWFELLKNRPDIQAYGYSKSWFELLGYRGALPTNYKLNLSSGHNHNKRTEKRIKKLSVTRGDFVALPVEKSVMGKYGTTEYKASLKRSAVDNDIDKYFACPGKCEFCAKGRHACGSEKFNGVSILIGLH